MGYRGERRLRARTRKKCAPTHRDAMSAQTRKQDAGLSSHFFSTSFTLILSLSHSRFPSSLETQRVSAQIVRRRFPLLSTLLPCLSFVSPLSRCARKICVLACSLYHLLFSYQILLGAEDEVLLQGCPSCAAIQCIPSFGLGLFSLGSAASYARSRNARIAAPLTAIGLGYVE